MPTLREWIIKNFQKRKAVIIYYAHEDGRLSKHWAIPEHDLTVKLSGFSRALIIHREAMRLSEGNIPTFFVHHSNCEAINLDDQRQSYFDAKEMRLILDNDEAHKVFQASQKGLLSNESLLIIGAIVVGFLAMFYFFNTKLNGIYDKIPDGFPIVEVEDNGE